MPMPTNDVMCYFMAPKAETRATQDSGHLLLISIAFTEIMHAKWKMKALSAVYKA